MTRTVRFLCGLAGLMIVIASHAGAPSVVALGAYCEGLQAPARVAIDAAGSLYVTEPQAGQVVVFDAFGRQVKVVPGFAGPLAIAVDANGRIYLGEESRGCVSVFDAQWNPLFMLGRGDREFALPNYIAPDSAPGSSLVFVSDSKAHQVKVYRQGVFAFSFGGQGTDTARFNFPTGVYVSANGEVFVVDQNNDRIQVFDRNGGFLRAFSLATPLGGMALSAVGGRSQGIIGDAQGRLLVADCFQGLVRVFDFQGNYLGRIGSIGTKPGQFSAPLGLALDSFNRLFTASLNNGRVEVLGLDAFTQLDATPARQLVGAGANVTFSATVSDPGACVFQWRKGTNLLADGDQVAGAAGPVLRLASVTPADAGLYSVKISRPGMELISPAAALGVLLPPSIAGVTSDQTVMAGTNVALAVTAAGDALSFQWFFRGQQIAGANDPTLALAGVQPDNAGAYSVLVQNAVGSVMSPASQLTVLVPPGQPTIEYTTLLPGTGMQLTINGDMGYTYWIDGASNLVDWVVLTNVVNETGSLEVVLPQAANSPGQFYRVRWTP